MVNENLIPKTETVYELKDKYEIPSYEEFMKTYEADENLNYADLNSGDISEAKGYGPCKNTLCSCSCSSEECTCANSSEWNGRNGAGHGASGRTWLSDGEAGAAGRVGAALARFKDSSEEVRYGAVSAGGKVEANLAALNLNLKGELGVNLHEYKSDGVYARTGISTENGLEAKFLGIGISLGKKNGIFIKVICVFIGLIAFLFCIYVLFRAWCSLFKILRSRCYFCDKLLENRTKEAIKFWLVPSLRRRKVEFICRNCKLKTRAVQ